MVEQLIRELDQGRLSPIYFLFGEETYLVSQALTILREKVVPAESRPFNYTSYSGATDRMSEALSVARTFPVISPHRMVVIEWIEEAPQDGRTALIEYLESPVDSTVLVLTARDMDRRTQLYKRLHREAHVLDFPKLKGRTLVSWVRTTVGEMGHSMSASTAEHLVDLCGPDLQVLRNELEKISLLHHAAELLPDEALDEVVTESRQHGIFEFIGALGSRNHKESFKLLGNLLQSGEKPLAVLGMMARHFRQVLIVKELEAAHRSRKEIMSAAQIPPFLMDSFVQQSRSIPADAAHRIYLKLADVDRRIKSSATDPKLLLESLIYGL